MTAESRRRPLGGLFVAQFFGAFNDNAMKIFIALLLIRGLTAQFATGTAEYEIAAQSNTTLAFVVLTLPLMLFSIPAAWCADRFSKRSILLWTKVGELALMASGTVALWFEPTGGPMSLVVLGCMGAQSAFFSPAKYGILPELVAPDQLTASNGRLEMWTFFAIIAGTAAGGALLDVSGSSPWVAGVVLMSLSVVGLVAIQRVPAVPPARADLSGGVLIGAWRAVRSDRVLWLAVLGSVFFWGVASLVSQDALVYAKSVLNLGDARAPLPLGVSVLGIGIGAALVGRLSRGQVEPGFIPLGTIGLAVACMALGLLEPGFHGTLFWMVVLGISSGCVVVPLNTLLQLRTPAARRGAVIALANALAFLGVLAGTLGCDAMARLGLTASEIFLGAAVVVLLGTAWAIWLLPLAGLRLFLVLLTQTFYRLTVRGRQNVPSEGPALLVSNHVSFIDGLLLQASLERPVRFLVDEHYYNKPFFRPIMKLAGFIPIAQNADPRELLKSLRAAGEYLDAGEVVCIFAEGEITRTGQLLPFRRGFQRILKGRDVPIVPVHLDRLWGSVFSFASGRPFHRFPRRIPYDVTVSLGEQLASSASVHEVHRAVQRLASDAWSERRRGARPLHHLVVRHARMRPWQFCCADEIRGKVSRIGLLTAATGLARALRDTWRDDGRVGVLLPPSVGAAAVNLASALAGRCVVNLNYTVGSEAIASAARQSRLNSIVTSRAFLERVGVELPEDAAPVFIEDLRARVGGVRRLIALLAALALPVRWLERWSGATRRPTAEDPVTVIFSSGSTGDPKGVVLSHFNVASNCDAAIQVLPITDRDRMLGILPLFHSFGLFALWLTLRSRVATVYHPNPLDAAKVGELVQRFGLTILVATPTFLQLYLRRVHPGQFGSLRLAIAGAEKLPQRVAEAFEERFGVRPLEGYGTTECSPVIAANSPGYRGAGFYQSGARRGTVGLPLPGIALRVTCLDTGEPVQPGESGMLWVRGPNLMQGYLDRDDLTSDVIEDGWYCTGDIACVDEDGFLSITDRLSRFSKLGGEMVPHGAVEAALQHAAGKTEQVFAVTGIPCEKKGEKLVVLHTLPSRAVSDVLAAMGDSDLPKLFLPRKENFAHVDELPLLGSGKLDLRALKREAEALFGSVELGSTKSS